MKNILYLIFIIFLSSCSVSQSTKQIAIIDKNIADIQVAVSETKESIVNVKQSLTDLKTKQPACNVKAVENQIELLELQINSIDGGLHLAREEIKSAKYIVDTEVRAYKNHCYIYALYTFIFIIILTAIRSLDFGKLFEFVSRVSGRN